MKILYKILNDTEMKKMGTQCEKRYEESHIEYEFNLRPVDRTEPNTTQLIMETCESVAAMLIDKNTAYGNSALNPLNIFSKTAPSESLVARIDDKLARIKNNDELLRDDIMDITGYLVLLLIEKGWVGYDGEEKL